MTPLSVIFMGRSGAGKGTQAKLLSEALKKIHDHPILYVETGAEFRKIAAGKNLVSVLTKETIDNGKLMPEFLCVYVWGKKMADEYTGNEHLIFDGTPRKLLEAKLLSGLFPFFGTEKPYVIYLNIDHGESSKRLSARGKMEGRKDDTPDAIERRRLGFEQDVLPTVDFYKNSTDINFFDIDGHHSIEDVHAEIVKKLGLS